MRLSVLLAVFCLFCLNMQPGTRTAATNRDFNFRYIPNKKKSFWAARTFCRNQGGIVPMPKTFEFQIALNRFQTANIGGISAVWLNLYYTRLQTSSYEWAWNNNASDTFSYNKTTGYCSGNDYCGWGLVHSPTDKEPNSMGNGHNAVANVLGKLKTWQTRHPDDAYPVICHIGQPV